MIPSSRQPEQARLLLTSPKSPTRQRVRNPLRPQSLQPRQNSTEPKGEECGTRGMLGMQIFQLYGNILTDEACQPWEKIMKAQTNTIPWEALRGEVHEKKAGITWTLSWIV